METKKLVSDEKKLEIESHFQWTIERLNKILKSLNFRENSRLNDLIDSFAKKEWKNINEFLKSFIPEFQDFISYNETDGWELMFSEDENVRTLAEENHRKADTFERKYKEITQFNFDIQREETSKFSQWVEEAVEWILK